MSEITDELLQQWPDLESVPDGVDVFAHLPIAGVPMTIELLAAMATLVEFVDKCAEEELVSDAVQMSAYIVFSAIREGHT